MCVCRSIGEKHTCSYCFTGQRRSWCAKWRVWWKLHLPGHELLPVSLILQKSCGFLSALFALVQQVFPKKGLLEAKIKSDHFTYKYYANNINSFLLLFWYFCSVLMFLMKTLLKESSRGCWWNRVCRFRLSKSCFSSSQMELHCRLSCCRRPSNELMFQSISQRSSASSQDTLSVKIHDAALAMLSRDEHESIMLAVLPVIRLPTDSPVLSFQLNSPDILQLHRTCLATTLKAFVFNNSFEAALLRSTFRFDSLVMTQLALVFTGQLRHSQTNSNLLH